MSRRSASSVSVASGVSRRASATVRTTNGCSCSRPSASSTRDRVELPACRRDRALEVRRLGVQDAIELAAQRPRDLARLELEEGARRADAAQERADGLGALPGHDATVAAHPPRRRAGRPRQAGRRAPGPRPAARRTRGGSGRRPGSASRARGTCRGARPSGNARPPCPSRTAPAARRRRRGAGGRPAGRPPVRARRGRCRARRDSASRSHGRAGSIAASSVRSATTRSRSVLAHRQADRVDGPPPGAGLGLVGCAGRARPAARVVVVGVVGVDDVVEHERGCGRSSAASAGGPPRRARSSGVRASNRSLARTRSTSPGAVWAKRASTWSARSMPSVSPSWVATLQT